MGESGKRIKRKEFKDLRSNNMKRPFNNKKRTKGRQIQSQLEKEYKAFKIRAVKMKKIIEDRILDEQIKLLNESNSN